MKKLMAFSLILACVLSLVGCKWMYDAQYNENGVSHFLVITIDESRPKEYIGDLDDHRIFVEKLDIEDTYFISVTDEHISIKEAIDNNLVSINEWKKYARKTQKDGDTEILQFENYEIMVSPDECIIRPLTKST